MDTRILVDPGAYHCQNMGDVAMMQVAVRRIKEFWPLVEVEVLTSRPDLLARFCPIAIPVPVQERRTWASSYDLVIGLRQALPGVLSRKFVSLERLLWLRFPQVIDWLGWIKAKVFRRKFVSPESFRRRLKRASLLILSGMGALNDAFPDVAMQLCDEMEAALQAGIPVIAFGQGIGPIEDAALVERARAVLPRLSLISIREGVSSLPLLKSLGTPDERILITGDDAIEMAFCHRKSELGSAIGINLRLAEYAGIDEASAAKPREAIRAAASRSKRSLVPVPISFHEAEADLPAITKLLGADHLLAPERLETPEDVMDLIGKCRVVVTGSYHAGVFALSQGIPIVAIVQSLYYEQKFKGLQQQFPGGCRILDLRTPLTSKEIENSILAAIESADTIRESLLAAAEQQVELSRRAYQIAHKLRPLESSNVDLSREPSSDSIAEIPFPKHEAR